MKLYYTDEKKNKRLIAEGEDIMKIIEAADADARAKFVSLKNLTLTNKNPECYAFLDTNGEVTGYSVEE